MEIDRSRAHLRMDRFRAEYESYVLPPGGWLVAVTVQVDRQRPDFTWPEGMNRNEPLHIEITDGAYTPLFGGFDIDCHTGFDQGGIAFEEPLPNLNTACPYVLRIEGAHPHLLVYTVNCWPDYDS